MVISLKENIDEGKCNFLEMEFKKGKNSVYS